MADGGARLFIVGFESGDAQILKNIKKGATIEMARNFMKNCRRVGIRGHGDFIIGLPGEPKETIQKTIEVAKELDCETIQVSLAHAMPGTELHDTMAAQGFLKVEALADSGGHQLPHIEYPHLSKAEMMSGVNQFYDDYYFRPKVVWRIVKEALWDSNQRKRLYHEATEFLKLRAERLKWARQGGEDYKKPMISVPETHSAHGNDTVQLIETERRLRIKTLVMVLAMVVCANAGDLMLKRGMTQNGAVQLTSAGVVHAFRLTATNGTIWAGIFFLTGFMVSYMTVLSWADYSYVMPAGAFGYALLTLMAVLFLHESVSPRRWVGVLLIGVGVLLVGQTKPRTTEVASE